LTASSTSGSSNAAPPVDRRAVRIDLTRPGRKRVEERTARAAAALEPIVSSLSAKDRAHLATLLTRLAADLA